MKAAKYTFRVLDCRCCMRVWINGEQLKGLFPTTIKDTLDQLVNTVQESRKHG